jgi:hypothetical protein
MTQSTLSPAIQQFDSLPASMLVSLNTASLLADRSRASLYRDVKRGLLTIIKVGKSTRLSVGDVRRLIGSSV